jgi:hypothetical protein
LQSVIELHEEQIVLLARSILTFSPFLRFNVMAVSFLLSGDSLPHLHQVVPQRQCLLAQASRDNLIICEMVVRPFRGHFDEPVGKQSGEASVIEFVQQHDSEFAFRKLLARRTVPIVEEPPDKVLRNPGGA